MCGEEDQQISERLDRLDEIGSDPVMELVKNMPIYSPPIVHTGWCTGVVPLQDQSPTLEFFGFPSSLDVLRQDFSGKVNSDDAIGVRGLKQTKTSRDGRCKISDLIPVGRIRRITADFLWPELPCSDHPCLKQATATFLPAEPRVRTRKNARNVTKLQTETEKLMTAPCLSSASGLQRGTQSLQCLTESTAQDNLAQAYFLEEQRFVETVNPTMDEKHESMLQCIQIPQFARSSSFHPEAFSNEGEIMQLDSSEMQSFEEFDVINIRGKVGADKSCTAISHLENKNTIETLEKKCGIAEDEISLEVLQQHFCHKRLDVAKKLGVSVSTLKRVMRKRGIRRWPFRNKKNECSIFESKLVTESVQDAVEAFSPTTSSHTNLVGSNYENLQHSKQPEPQREKMTSPFCKKSSIGGQIEMQDASIVIIKAKYGENFVRFPLYSTSGIVELKEEFSKRLELELGSFNVKYQDEDCDWVLITCDADLHDSVTCSSSSSVGNQVIKLLVDDKVANFRNSGKFT